MRSLLIALILIIPTLTRSQDMATAISAINTQYEEECPVLSPDGKLLAFTVASHPANIGGVPDHGDIWFSTWTGTQWTAPVHGGPLINNTLHNTVAGFSPDGTQMFIMNHFAGPGKPVTSQGISVSIKNGDSWLAPVNISIPYFKNNTEYNTGALSADGTVLVFAGIGYQTRGGVDLYLSRKVNGKWTEPKDLGPVINTRQHEVTPSLSPDGKRLFFGSNGIDKDVSFDVYYSDRLDDTWTNWSAPVNLGPGVNGIGREYFYRQTPIGAFYSATRNSDEFADIHFIPSRDTVEVPVMINPTEEIKVVAVDTLLKIDEVTYDKKNIDGRTRIWGKVYNAKTNQVIPGAVIHFTASENYPATASANGNFEISVLGVEEYSVKVEAPGYIGEFERLDLRTQVLKDLEMNFRLHPIEIGETINLKSVLFERSKDVMLVSSYDELNMVVDFMKENPKVEILLTGHTDNQGRHDALMKLSRQRVEKVKQYMVEKGISEKRITSKGLGGTKPIADNEAEETRALNRRVEFTITKD
jgi:outer membrane protein OmpA-like peptidoglycan-associated protein/Tol biopolymer transport system component